MPKTLEDRLQAHYQGVRDTLNNLLAGIDSATLSIVKEEMKAELQAESFANAEVPATTNDRKALIDYAFTLEEDMLIRSTAAAFILDADAAKYRVERFVRQALFYALFVLFVPLLGVLTLVLNWSGGGAAFWVVLGSYVIAYVIAFIAVIISNTNYYARCNETQKRISAHRITSYNLAMKARKAYTVDMLTAGTKLVLTSTLDRLADDRARIVDGRWCDRDDAKFDPSLSLLERAKNYVDASSSERIKPAIPISDAPV